MYKLLIAVLMVVALSSSATGDTLFVGLEGSAPPVHSSDLAGFPSVTWESHYSFDVSGAAATPDGELYLVLEPGDLLLFRNLLLRLALPSAAV